MAKKRYVSPERAPVITITAPIRNTEGAQKDAPKTDKFKIVREKIKDIFQSGQMKNKIIEHNVSNERSDKEVLYDGFVNSIADQSFTEDVLPAELRTKDVTGVKKIELLLQEVLAEIYGEGVYKTFKHYFNVFPLKKVQGHGNTKPRPNGNQNTDSSPQEQDGINKSLEIFILKNSPWITDIVADKKNLLEKIGRLKAVFHGIEHGGIDRKALQLYEQRTLSGIYRISIKNRGNRSLYIRYFKAEGKFLICAYASKSAIHQGAHTLHPTFKTYLEGYSYSRMPQWDSKVQVQPIQEENKAMVISDNLGGIGLNSANLAMSIKRNGKGVPLPLVEQDMAQLSNIQGFEPHILEITPAMNFPILNELKQKL